MSEKKDNDVREAEVTYDANCSSMTYEKEWQDETDKRLQEVLNGDVNLISGDQVIAEMRAKLSLA